MVPQSDRFLLTRSFNEACLSIVFLLCILFPACSDTEETRLESPSDVLLFADVESQGTLDVVEMELDLSEDVVFAPEFAEPPFLAPDDDLRLSMAFGELFAPLGISTAGYGQTIGDDDPKSPFAKGFRASKEILHPPAVRVIHLLKGDRRSLWVQTDLIGIYYLFYERIADMVQDRTGVDVRESMILMANHTHAGPGRLVNFVVGGMFADAYNEVFFEKIMMSIAEPIIEALSAEATPVKFGHHFVQDVQIHKDRRCENPEYTNDTMAVLRFDDAASGKTRAVVLNYAMHGTVFAVKDGKLSGDAPRAVELKVEEIIPDSPLVMFVQSWGGDMAPHETEIEGHKDEYEADFEPKLDELEAIGRRAAEKILSIWDEIQMDTEIELDFTNEVIPIGYEQLGYTEEVFSYEFGGAFCGGTGSYCPGTEKEPNMDFCLGIPEEYALSSLRIAVMRLGDLLIVTLPGEPLTTLGEYLLDKVSAAFPNVSPLLFGYAQDYSGYLLMPDDWYAGGYEAASNFWGPFQGQYIADRAASVALNLLDPTSELDFEETSPLPYLSGDGEVYQPASSIEAGNLELDWPSTAPVGAVLSLSWNGGDPWLGTPEAVLQKANDDGGYEDYFAGGRRVDVGDYRISLTMSPSPEWTADDQPGAPSVARKFVWTAALRTAVKVMAPSQELSGKFRLGVSGVFLDESGEQRAYELFSSPVDLIHEDSP